MTDEELDEIERRCKAATPGPWRWGSWDTNFGDREPTNLLDRKTLEHYPQVLDGSACVRNAEDDSERILNVEDPVERYEDALFIMKARLDVERLIGEVRRLRALTPEGRGPVLCKCRTFHLDGRCALIDGCGFLHTTNRCPDEKWLTDEAL